VGGRKREEMYVSCKDQTINMEWGGRGGGEKGRKRESVQIGTRDTGSERERERERE